MATFVQRSGPGGRRVWQVKIRRRGYPPQSGTFDSKGRAEAWARQIEGEMDRGIFVSRAEAESTTLADALERYALEVAPKKKDAYHDTLRCRRLSKRTLARKALAAIRGKDIATFIRERQAEGVGANMIRLDLALLSHLFNTARTAWGMESLTNPMDLVKGQRPKLPGGRDRRLVGDELPRLLAVAQAYDAGPHAGIGIANVITWAIETAMRRGEIAAMRWDHLDGPSGPQCRKARVLLIPETKTGTPRRVPLSTAALAVLDSLPRRMGHAAHNVDGRVWGIGHSAYNVRPDSISQAFERVCKAAGIEV